MNLVTNPKKSLLFSSIFVLFAYLSFIPASNNGSLYDYLIPFIITCFILVNLNKFNYKIGNSFFLIILANLFASFSILLRINTYNLFGNFALLLRLLNFSLIFYLISKEYYPFSFEIKSFKKNISQLIILNFFFYTITSSLSFISFFNGSWRFGFPFYANGTDPHVWGPSVMLSLIFLLLSFLQINNLKVFSKVSNLSKYLLLSIFPFLIFAAISSGSRGVIAILISFLFLIFIKSFDFINLRISLLNKKIFLSVFFKLLIAILFLVTLFIIFLFSFGNFSEYIIQRSERLLYVIKRTFEVINLFTGEDLSRSTRIGIVNNFFLSGQFLQYPFGRLQETYREDSGIMLYVLNYGWVSGITIISAALIELKKSLLQKSSLITPISVFVSASLFISFLGSETILIPRFLLFLMPAIYLFISLRKYNFIIQTKNINNEKVSIDY